MSVNQIPVIILKEHVQKAIEKWHKNELPSEARIASDHVILYSTDDVPDPMDMEHPYNRFLHVVATGMVAVCGEDTKTFFRQLYRHSKQWRELIATKQDKPPIPTQARKKNERKMENHGVKTKPRKQEVQIVREVAATVADEEIDDEGDQLPLAWEGKRQLFEEGKEAILVEVPEEVKARFGTICFVKWAKHFLPVLVMNPYWVPPGAARKSWLNTFDHVRNKDRFSQSKYFLTSSGKSLAMAHSSSVSLAFTVQEDRPN